MTSKFSIDNRELLQRISSGEAVVGIDFGNLIVRELAAFRLAAMDSEPVAEVVSIYGDPEAFGEREIRPLVGIQQMPYGTKLYRHAKPDASHLSRICAESYQVVGALAEALRVFNDVGVIKALDNLATQELIHDDVLPFSVPEAAQPAPVVPDDVSIFEAAIEECKTCDSIDEHAWNHGVLAVIAKYESCRAAMLAAAPQLPGREPATVPGKWIPVSERIPDVGVKVLCFPVEDEPIHAAFNGQLWLQDISWSNSDEPIDNVITCNVTHWMPLPAAPQEVKP